MDATLESTAVIYPGAQITTLARLVKADKTLLSSSDLSAIRLQVFEDNVVDPIALSSLGATGIVVATSTATNTLATTSGWSEDKSGFNFSHTFDTDTFLTGGKRYRAEYRISTSSLGDLFVVVNIEVKGTGQSAT